MMMRPALFAAMAAAVTLTACAGSGQQRYTTGVREPISLRDDDDLCGASLIQTYIGLRANQTVREEVTRRSGAATIRWIAPGDAVTMDFSAARLNVELDEDGVVTTFRCG
jgi:Peptidase inhibitor I78 family